MSVWSGTPFPVDLVTSDSMTPSLMEGDVVAWTPTNIEDLKVGDVIVFKSYVHWPDEKIVVHRVSDIIVNSRGELLLETKGDKNDWTDQAGPHIPEPYIREGNLMGKVISVGQQPLKVPFVGIFGIWINEGLDGISQPTSSKESINYLGIFAPLTISAVVLVILIFILPERAKTIPEKLRKYIIGTRPLNLKRTITTFLIAYVVFLMFIHVFAHDSITASVGINQDSEDSGVNFGRIKPGTESLPKDLPIINPSIMPVKGIVFARGNIDKYITKRTFELEKGQINVTKLQAIANINALNGTYNGTIMVYSSVFWLIFPDNFIESLYNINAEASVYILDILAGVILTSLTLLILVSITFIGDTIKSLMIDISWIRPSKIILKKGIRKRFWGTKTRVKESFNRNIVWMVNTNYVVKEKDMFISEFGKPIIASLAIVPIIFFLADQMGAMIISAIIAGTIAYIISCKLRRKIFLTVLIVTIISTLYMVIQSNNIIFNKEAEFLELVTLSIGVIGVYMLILVLVLIPLGFISWKISRLFRNLKEQKDPLLSLEGSCDL